MTASSPSGATDAPASHALRTATQRALAWLGMLVLGGALGVALLVGLALALVYPRLPDIGGLTDYQPKLPMRILSRDGQLLGEFGEERRSYLPIEEIPKVMQEAVLAIEDARFYQHGGVDYLGVLRAGLANIGESRSQGASTITMQVARNFYLSTEKTFTRKIYEILLALKIESALPKDRILEIYMNQIFLGHRAYGFAAAAEVYFGKPLDKISLAEAAMLAGLPKAPSAYNPINNPRRATVRQQYILDRMYDTGYITEEQRDAAKAERLRYRVVTIDTPGHAEFAAETARQLIFGQYGDEAYTRGMNVYLTLTSDEQTAAYRALRRGIMDYERRQVYRGPEAYADLPADPKALDQRVAELLADHPANDELLAAVVLEADPKKVSAVLQTGETIQITGEGLRPATSGLSDRGNPKTRIRRGAVIRVVKDPVKPLWTITQLPEVEGAFVALDPQSGEVHALVGGFDYAKSKFNHVTQAWRQPGSSFKPFIYSSALERGFTPATIVNDAPLFFDAGATGSQPWEPKNYDGKFEGPMPLRTALAKSKNMVSIRVLHSVGVKYAQEWITRFGFDAEKHPAYLTMALGAGSVTPMQMAQGYAVFANGGYRITPQLIARITDSKGRQLYEAPQATQPSEDRRAIEPRNAFIMSQLLQEVTRSGTAARAQATLKRSDIYGKTGTTNDSMDAWFAGYQKDLVAVVWIGYDQPRKLGDKETGGGLSLPVWIEFMAQALKNKPQSELEPPEGVVHIGNEWFYDEYSGKDGVRELTGDEGIPGTVSEEEKKSILDIFKR
ncbi:penicillin-binding protein 1A [Roseateles paludis]